MAFERIVESGDKAEGNEKIVFEKGNVMLVHEGNRLIVTLTSGMPLPKRQESRRFNREGMFLC